MYKHSEDEINNKQLQAQSVGMVKVSEMLHHIKTTHTDTRNRQASLFPVDYKRLYMVSIIAIEYSRLHFDATYVTHLAELFFSLVILVDFSVRVHFNHRHSKTNHLF